MTAAVRMGDLCTGHSCFPPRPPASWSPNVKFNSKNVIRVGDAWAVHCCIPVPCHGGNQASGSPDININGRKLARIGDSINCGSSNAHGSPDIFANGR